MQTDMHYYGTYAMARAAGLIADAARVMATAAEYVDDSDAVGLQLSDGSFLYADPTAHHPLNKANIEPIDQRRIWVPFHFIPGNEGDTVEERLVCRIDSALAREMVAFHLEGARGEAPLERIGIAAHAYADTFSHYGFSGVASEFNRVDASTINLEVSNPNVLAYITSKASAFADKYLLGAAANVVGLGHGSVATYPDRPYLRWRFRYQRSGTESGLRDNPKTFLEGCRRLHAMFCDFAEVYPDVRDPVGPKDFGQLEAVLKKILAVEGSMASRVAAWKEAASEGGIFDTTDGADIPDYDAGLFAKDIEIMTTHTAGSVSGTSGFGFLRAAQLHRDFVLGQLLPKHDLPVLLAM